LIDPGPQDALIASRDEIKCEHSKLMPKKLRPEVFAPADSILTAPCMLLQRCSCASATTACPGDFGTSRVLGSSRENKNTHLPTFNQSSNRPSGKGRSSSFPRKSPLRSGTSPAAGPKTLPLNLPNRLMSPSLGGEFPGSHPVILVPDPLSNRKRQTHCPHTMVRLHSTNCCIIINRV
jgi:hypothetical protein